MHLMIEITVISKILLDQVLLLNFL